MWWLYNKGLPQGSGLGPTLFNHVKFNHQCHSGSECTLSKSVDDTKLHGAIDLLEGRDATQRDLNNLGEWVYVNLMKFNMAKHKVLLLAWGNPQHQHRLGDEGIEGLGDTSG